MKDSLAIPEVLKLASAAGYLLSVQHAAADKLLKFDGEHYPSDGCAITLSTLLQAGGIDVPDTFLAIQLGQVLKGRGWQVIPVGRQQKGDVGSTCGDVPDHGNDHIYFVVDAMNSDEMVIADNQADVPHFRFASGKGGKTPTKFFLRASQGVSETLTLLAKSPSGAA
jgi:hypothetical protein